MRHGQLQNAGTAIAIAMATLLVGGGGGGGGGGGYFNTSIPSTPLVIKGSRGRGNANGEDGVALLFTGTTGW